MPIIFAIISDARDATPIKSSFVDCQLSVSIVGPLTAITLKIESRYSKTIFIFAITV